MTSRRTIASTLAAVALMATIAAPAIAGAPTYSGTLTCIRAQDGESVELNTLTGATRQEIAVWKRYWTSGSGHCKNGSVGTSGLTKDA